MPLLRHKDVNIMDTTCINAQGVRECFACYLQDKLGMYADEKDIRNFESVLYRIKTRQADNNSVEDLCKPVFMEPVLRLKGEPCRILEVRNLYALLFNMTGFINISRNEAAMILKRCFPNVFANTKVISINKSLTRYKFEGMDTGMKIPYLRSSDSQYFENMLNKYIR